MEKQRKNSRMIFFLPLLSREQGLNFFSFGSMCSMKILYMLSSGIPMKRVKSWSLPEIFLISILELETWHIKTFFSVKDSTRSLKHVLGQRVFFFKKSTLRPETKPPLYLILLTISLLKSFVWHPSSNATLLAHSNNKTQTIKHIKT